MSTAYEDFKNKRQSLLYFVDSHIKMYNNDYESIFGGNTHKLETYVYSYISFFQKYQELYKSIPDFINNKVEFIVYTFKKNSKITEYILTILKTKRELDYYPYIDRKIKNQKFEKLINNLCLLYNNN